MKYICDHAGMLEKCKECEFSKIHEEAGCCKQPGYCDIDDDTGYNTKCVPFEEVSENKYGVHQTHCCIVHGCKYGDADCPVVNEKILQDNPCEDCDIDKWFKDKETDKWYHGRIFVNSFDEAFDKESKWKNHVLGIIVNGHVSNNRYNLSFHYKSLFDLNRQIEMLRFVDSLDKNDRELFNDYVKEQITIESYNEVE